LSASLESSKQAVYCCRQHATVEEKQGAAIVDTTSEQPSDLAIFAAQFFKQTKLMVRRRSDCEGSQKQSPSMRRLILETQDNHIGFSDAHSDEKFVSV